MKRLLVIISLPLLFALPLITRADDYIDDVYFSADVFLSEPDDATVHEPYYNKKAMQQIIFLDDTVNRQHPDTVRIVIKR